MLDILFEDHHIMVLNKAAGLVVHAGSGISEPTLVDALIAYCPLIKEVGDVDRSGIVHRLDRYTEGLMVVAKTQEACQHLQNQFRKRQISKRYYAWVKGDVDHDDFTLTYALGRHPSKRHLQWVVQEGKEAETSFYVLKRCNTKTLLDVVPTTGRTHQIRVHLAYIQYPVMQDREYGRVSKNLPEGQLLQAYSLVFMHPKYNKKWEFKLPMSHRMGG